MPLRQRQHERRHAVGRGIIHVRAVVDQYADRFHVTGEHRVKEGREAARRPRRIGFAVARELRRVGSLALPQQDRPAARPPPPRHVRRGLGTGVDQRRPCIDQCLHHAGVPFRGRPHQRGMPAGRCGVHVRPGCRQPLYDGGAAGPRREHDGRVAGGARSVGIRAGAEQQLDHRQAPVVGRQHQRRHVQVVRRADVSAGRNQARRQVDLVPVRRPGDRGCAVALRGVHIDATAGEQFAGGIEVTLLDRVDEPPVGIVEWGCGLRRGRGEDPGRRDGERDHGHGSDT